MQFQEKWAPVFRPELHENLVPWRQLQPIHNDTHTERVLALGEEPNAPAA